jgi:hypothetical protein
MVRVRKTRTTLLASRELPANGNRSTRDRATVVQRAVAVSSAITLLAITGSRLFDVERDRVRHLPVHGELDGPLPLARQ